MTNLGRKIEIFIIVVIIAVIGIVYAFRKPAIAPTTNTEPSQNTQQQEEQPVSSGMPVPGSDVQDKVVVTANVIEYRGVDGKNALELLQASHRVDLKHYSFGDLVTGIDGITPDASHFWALYVNGQFSQVGASAYITKSSDTIRWQIDEVKN